MHWLKALALLLLAPLAACDLQTAPFEGPNDWPFPNASGVVLTLEGDAPGRVEMTVRRTNGPANLTIDIEDQTGKTERWTGLVLSDVNEAAMLSGPADGPVLAFAYCFDVTEANPNVVDEQACPSSGVFGSISFGEVGSDGVPRTAALILPDCIHEPPGPKKTMAGNPPCAKVSAAEAWSHVVKTVPDLKKDEGLILDVRFLPLEATP